MSTSSSSSSSSSLQSSQTQEPLGPRKSGEAQEANSTAASNSEEPSLATSQNSTEAGQENSNSNEDEQSSQATRGPMTEANNLDNVTDALSSSGSSSKRPRSDPTEASVDGARQDSDEDYRPRKTRRTQEAQPLETNVQTRGQGSQVQRLQQEAPRRSGRPHPTKRLVKKPAPPPPTTAGPSNFGTPARLAPQTQRNAALQDQGQPQKVFVDESEVDLDSPDYGEEEDVVPRSQKGVKKEGSEDVADRPTGTDKKLKGEVRLLKDRSGLVFRDAKNPNWTKAEFHFRLRPRFIQEANASQSPYAEEPRSGNGATDVTSRCTNQKDWTSGLQTVLDPNGTPILSGGYEPNAFYERSPPDWVLPDGRVVLDINGHPVRMFSNIPSTLSSEVEPWRMEGLRLLNGMGINDLMARMPKYTETSDKRLQNLQGPSAFTNRLKNWRARMGLKPLKKGRPTKKSKEAIKSERSVAESAERDAEGETDEEVSPKSHRSKRLKVEDTDSSKEAKGTAAQRANAQLRARQAGAGRGGRRRQAGAASRAADVERYADQMYVFDASAASPQVQPRHEADPFLGFDNTNEEEYAPRLEETANFEEMYEPYLPVPRSPSQHFPLAQGALGYQGQQPLEFSSSDLPAPTLQTAPVGYDPRFNLPQPAYDLYVHRMQGPAQSFRGQRSNNAATGPYTPLGWPGPPAQALPSTLGSGYGYPDPEFGLASQQPIYGSSATSFNNALPPMPPYDFRFHMPADEDESYEIEYALSRTIECFEEAHPHGIGPEVGWSNYHDAVELWQARHMELCQMSGQVYRPLPSLGPWYNTLDSWRSLS